jgi:hypothetical protein
VTGTFRYDGAMARPASVLLAFALAGCEGSPPDVVLYANGNFGSWPLAGGPATKVTPLLTGVAWRPGPHRRSKQAFVPYE